MSEKEFKEIFSKRLRHFLSINNMTQKELAEKIGVGTTSVYNWCNGVKIPRMDKVDAMCELFGCLRRDLMEESTISNETYYLNPETAQIAQDLYDNPDLRILFDAGRDAKPEDLQMAANLLTRLKETNPDG